jgi:DNA-binding response OmpR family regulator
LDESEAFSHGADDYLLKPFSPNDLHARIQFQKSKQFFASALALEREQHAGKLPG